MNLVKTISTAIDSLQRRVVKILRMGRSDVQTALEASPYGIDSNPVKNMIAVYAATGTKGKPVIIGYINKNQQAAIGEMRQFSTDADGAEKFYTWLKNNGTLELGGDAHNIVRYNPLNTELQALATAINAQLALIAAGITAGGGSYTPGNISINISQAKINEIKTL